MSNPFVDLQQRLSDLLSIHAYFASEPADARLTEKIGDIDAKILNDLLPLGFGFAIKTAKGEGQSSLGITPARELITVTFIHNPTTRPDKSALDALAAGLEAIIGKPIFPTTVIRRETDCWQFAGHARRDDAPPELHVHELYVAANVKLQGAPLRAN